MAAHYDFLETVKRVETGSKVAKALRRNGKIPGIFYYKGEENIKLSFDRQTLLKTLHKGGHIFELDLEGTKQYAMIKEVQYHPVTDEIIHLDLMRVRRDEKINISVPLVLEGEALGVTEGGVMMQSLSTVEISCLPENVPEQITLDITLLALNSSLFVADIIVSSDIAIVTDEQLVITTITLPKEEEEPEVEPEEGEEGEEGEEEGEEGEKSSEGKEKSGSDKGGESAE